MAIVTGTNAGFVTVSPSADPTGSQGAMKTRCNAVKFTSPSGSNKIVEFGFFVSDPPDVNEDWEMGLYTHDGANDLPEDLVGSVGQGTATVAAGTGWQTAAVDTAISASTTYWIAVASTGNSDGDFDYDFVASGGTKLSVDTGPTTCPDPYTNGPAAELDNYNAAYYAKYEAVAGANAPTADLQGPLVGPFGGPIMVTI